MDSQRKRTSNFSADEKRILSELVLKYQNVIENKQTDSTTNSDKLKGWIRLAEEFNNISTYCHRSHATLKCCWENIKRNAKKKRAVRKKNIFMTGGGRPPASPPATNQDADKIVEAVLGPALEGHPNIYDSDAVLNEVNEPLYVIEEDNLSPETLKENADIQENNDRVIIIEDMSSPGGILLENNNIGDDWHSWTPKNLKTPVSDALKVSKKKGEDWLKRRRPKNECSTDLLIKEKIHLVKILQENAAKESIIRLAILEEQLKQEKLKTQQCMEK